MSETISYPYLALEIIIAVVIGKEFCMSTGCKAAYRKLGNFHVDIIHVVNIHVDLFSWVYGTHENILT